MQRNHLQAKATKPKAIADEGVEHRRELPKTQASHMKAISNPTAFESKPDAPPMIVDALPYLPNMWRTDIALSDLSYYDLCDSIKATFLTKHAWCKYVDVCIKGHTEYHYGEGPDEHAEVKDIHYGLSISIEEAESRRATIVQDIHNDVLTLVKKIRNIESDYETPPDVSKFHKSWADELMNKWKSNLKLVKNIGEYYDAMAKVSLHTMPAKPAREIFKYHHYSEYTLETDTFGHLNIHTVWTVIDHGPPDDRSSEDEY